MSEFNVTVVLDLITKGTSEIVNSIKGIQDVSKQALDSPFDNTKQSAKELNTSILAINPSIQQMVNLTNKLPIPFSNSSSSANDLKKSIANVSSSTGQLTDGTLNTSKNINNMVSGARRFNFIWLRLAFLGTTLQRIFGGLLRSVINTFVEGAGRADPFSRALTQISGKLEFLRFALGKAFAESDVGKWLINFFDTLIDKVISLVDKFPNLSVAVVSVIAALLSLGILFNLISLIGQLSVAISFLKVGIFTLGITFKKLKIFTLLTTVPLLLLKKSIFILLTPILLIGKVIKNILLKSISIFGKVVLTLIKKALTPLFSKLTAIFKPILLLVKGILAVVGVKLALISAILAIGVGFSKFRDNINDFLKRFGFVGNVLRIFGNILAIIFNQLFSIITGVLTLIGRGIKKTVDFIKGVITKLLDFFSPVIDFFKGIGSAIAKFTGFIADVTQEANKKSSETAGLWEQKDTLKSTSRAAEDFSSSISYLPKEINDVSDSFSLFEPSSDVVISSFDKLKNKGSELKDSFQDWGSNFINNETSLDTLGLSSESLNSSLDDLNSSFGSYDNVLEQSVLNTDNLINSDKELLTETFNLTNANFGFSNSINENLIPALNSEENSVNSLIQKYKELAEAKKRASGSFSQGTQGTSIFNRFTTTRG